MTYEKIEENVDQSGLERSHDHRAIATTVFLSTIYATVRYNVFKGVPWADWPHFIVNKCLALSGLVLIALSVFRLASRTPRRIGRLMAAGSAFALIHTLVSLGLFNAAYFDKFFAGEKLSLAGGASLMIAAMAVALLNWGKGRPGSSATTSSIGPLGAIAFLSGLHAALPSASTWLDPVTWPGRMPPITLIPFVVGAIALICALGIRTPRWARSTDNSKPNEA